MDPLTEHQRRFQETVRSLLDRWANGRRLREVMAGPDGWDRALWRRLTRELGVLGPVPDGGPTGVRELVLVAQQLGRVLAPVPFLGVAATVQALARGTDSQLRAHLLPGLMAGDIVVVWADGDVAERDGALHGEAPLVPHGSAADLFLLAGADTVYLVAADAAGVHRRRLATIDPTRPATGLRLRGAPATRLETVAPDSLVSGITDLVAVLLAAEQSGGITACVEMTVAHTRTRQQFGRPIGSFQAVQHQCADMHAAAELTEATVRHAACADLAPQGEFAIAAAVAAIQASQAYCQVAANTVHLHGGLGFTWEHDAQLHYKRARAGTHLFGHPRDQREWLAEQLGL